MLKKIFFSVLFLSLLLTVSLFRVDIAKSQTPTVTPEPTSVPESSSATSKVSDCANNNISVADCEGYIQRKLDGIKVQKNTLSGQIDVMENQISLTEARIESTKAQLLNLSVDIDTADKKIGNLEKDLSGLTNVLINRIVATYKVGTSPSFQILLASNSVSNFFTKLNYLKIAQAHDKKLIYDTQQAKTDYANQKSIFEEKKEKVETLKKQLEGYTLQLDQDKKNKEDLLALTRNDESRYQKMLAEARAQINSFKSFTAAKTGGFSSILPAQASPDGWYYNQRDERWGRNTIGSSGDQVWEVGCLLTSVAMVLKKNGENVSPSDVAAVSSYFVPTTASMRIPWAGGRFTSTWSYNQEDIDTRLSRGEAIIVGVKVTGNSVGTHFLVLKSGSGGNYIMNDPWYGANLNFSDHYNTDQIFQYGHL